MNKESERGIIEAAVTALQDLGLNARARYSGRGLGRADAVLTVRHGGTVLQYLAEVKRRLTPSLVGPISLAFSIPTENRLLITDHVTPPIAEAFRLHGVQFVDAVGNAYLSQDGILVIVSGRTPRKPASRTTSLRVFLRTGLKIVFVLLSAPSLVSAPQRAIAEAANVSLGSVPLVLEGLRQLGYLVEVRGTRRIVERTRLIDQWSEGHARVLQPALEIGRFSAGSADWWRHTNPVPYGVQWGGETAAALLGDDLRPEQTIIYTDALPARLITEQRLKADRNGSVVFRRRFWNAVPSPAPEVVPPLLIYADLVAAGDGRSLSAAKRIRERYLD
ncbi:MAG: type IV toxin-antitoxin system AbiEi family antitoxin [Acidobacteriota bacterium]|nr:type IV toxin-antitoxin system AbiEi family antitoxin [Acidobacteriota bacterium]